MWQGIQFLARNGAEKLHFGRTEQENEGLRRFKLSWNTQEETIDYFRVDPSGRQCLAPARSHDSGLPQESLWEVATNIQQAGGLNDLSASRLKVKTMAEIRRETQQHHSGIHLSDILFALFKRKRTIILCAVVGIIAAAAFYFFYPPVYESQAKLLVRYVLERSAVDPIEAEKAAAASSNYTDRVIDAEIEILTSWDLAVQVAEAIGPKRLLPPATDLLTKVAHAIGLKPPSAAATEAEAASAISLGLKVISNKGSNIIFVSYKNHDPQMATLVLQELLSRYFVKHLEVHRSAGAFDFVTQQTDQVRARLNQTEDALKSMRDKTGIVSLKEGSAALTAEAAKTQEALNAAEAELAEGKAVVNQIGESKAKKWGIKGQPSEKSSSSGKARVAGIEAKVETLKTRLRDIQQKMKQLSELRSANGRLGAETGNGRSELQVFRGIARKGARRRGFGPLQNAQH